MNTGTDAHSVYTYMCACKDAVPKCVEYLLAFVARIAFTV